ncbi:MAG: grasp-with-spasm system SPASM domain peptide maturase [Bacteroidota bacterium]
MNRYFNLFANCFIVYGFNRSLIFDAQRMKTVFIPNDIYEIIMKAKNNSIEQIYEEYGLENKSTIDEYFDSLIENELGFYLSEKERAFFPNIDTKYHSPFEITNCVLEEMRDSALLKNTISQLEALGCQYVELIFYKDIINEYLENILTLFKSSSIKYIGLIIPYTENKDTVFLKKICTQHLRLNKILIHGVPSDKENDKVTHGFTDIIYVHQPFTNFSYCGTVSKKFFSPSMEHYMESQNHNSCLNQKISVDANGNIRNCPALPKSFGNIKETTLSEAIHTRGYKQMWSISKDDIDTCKDCEFRHICTDCRAFVEAPEDYYSKPLKCGYDPYTNTWSEWSTNPLKKKGIEFYKMKDITQEN